MKKIMVILAAMTLAPLAQAWEVPGNPDARPSVFLGYEKGGVDGSIFSHQTGFSAASHPLDVDITKTQLSLRLPLNSMLTVDLGVERLDEDQTIRSNTLTQDTNISGNVYSIGARFYLP